MEIKTAFEGQCSTASFIASTYDIVNIPQYKAMDIVDRESRLWGNPSTQPAIQVVEPNSRAPTDWVYITIDDMPQYLPLNKTLVVECPVPACVFPISGYYGPLSRALFYVNMFVAALATLIPLLRGIAQIWLSTFTTSAAIHFLVMQQYSSPQIYNLDIEPTIHIVHLGMYSALFWFFAKGDHKTTGSVAPAARATEPDDAVRPVRKWLARFWGKARELPFAFYYLLWILATFAVAGIFGKSVPPILAASIVLDSRGDYRLTSNCYSDAFGNPHMWDTTVKSSIRRLSDVTIYEPPSGTLASDALMVISESNMRVFHIGAALWCLIVIRLSPFFAKSRVGRRLVIPPRSRVGRWLSVTQESRIGRRLLLKLPGYSKGRRSSWLRLSLILFLITAAVAAIAIIVFFEQELLRNNIPEGEQPFEIGQWGPCVTATLVFILITGPNLIGVEFDTSDRSGLHWLWCESRQNDLAQQNETAPHVLPILSKSNVSAWRQETSEAIQLLPFIAV